MIQVETQNTSLVGTYKIVVVRMASYVRARPPSLLLS